MFFIASIIFFFFDQYISWVTFKVFLILYISILLHELAHWLTIKIVGYEIEKVGLKRGTISIIFRGEKFKKIIALSGCLVNILLAIVFIIYLFFVFNSLNHDFYSLFTNHYLYIILIFTNLSLLINILPGFDDGNILFDLN